MLFLSASSAGLIFFLVLILPSPIDGMAVIWSLLLILHGSATFRKLCVAPLSCKLPPNEERDIKYLNPFAHCFCWQRELSLGCQRSIWVHYPLLHCLFGTAYKLFKSLGRLREAETSDGEGLEPPQLEIGDQGQRQEGAGQDARSSRKARKVPIGLPKLIGKSFAWLKHQL